MDSFLTSHSFLLFAILAAVVMVLFAVLRGNTRWTARGITPSAMVAALRKSGNLVSWVPEGYRVPGFLALCGAIAFMWFFSGNNREAVLDFLGFRFSSIAGWLVPVLVIAALCFGLGFVFAKEYRKYFTRTALGICAVSIAAAVLLLNKGMPFMDETAGSQAGRVEAEIPLASTPVKEWPVLALAPRGRSIILPVLKLSRPTVSGSGFLVHCVYQDGHEKTASGSNGCTGDDISHLYLTNTEGKANLVRYAYVLK